MPISAAKGLNMQKKPDLIDVPIKPGLFVDEQFDPGQARLRATRCRHCREVFFPPRSVCPRCQQQTMDELALGRVGKINAITAVTRPPRHYAAPFLLAEVDLSDGVRLLAHVDADRGELAVGASVTMTTRGLFISHGKRYWGYVFCPDRQPGGVS